MSIGADFRDMVDRWLLNLHAGISVNGDGTAPRICTLCRAEDGCAADWPCAPWVEISGRMADRRAVLTQP